MTMHGHVCGPVVIYGHLWSYLLIKPLKTLCFRNGLGDTVFTPFFFLLEHRFVCRFQYVLFFPPGGSNWVPFFFFLTGCMVRNVF